LGWGWDLLHDEIPPSPGQGEGWGGGGICYTTRFHPPPARGRVGAGVGFAIQRDSTLLLPGGGLGWGWDLLHDEIPPSPCPSLGGRGERWGTRNASAFDKSGKLVYTYNQQFEESFDDDELLYSGSYLVQLVPYHCYWGGALARWAGGCHRLLSDGHTEPPNGAAQVFVSSTIGLTDQQTNKDGSKVDLHQFRQYSDKAFTSPVEKGVRAGHQVLGLRIALPAAVVVMVIIMLLLSRGDGRLGRRWRV